MLYHHYLCRILFKVNVLIYLFIYLFYFSVRVALLTGNQRMVVVTICIAVHLRGVYLQSPAESKYLSPSSGTIWSDLRLYTTDFKS